MNNVTVNLSNILNGSCQGVSTDSSLFHKINERQVNTFTQNGTGATLLDQMIDRASTAATLTAGSTTTIDLTTGTTNPLGESITGADAFLKIRVIFVFHESTSAASSISVFNSAANAFQGPVSAAGTITLKPGEGTVLWSSTTAGWAVAGATKNVKLLNNDGVNAATVSYFIGGSKT